MYFLFHVKRIITKLLQQQDFNFSKWLDLKENLLSSFNFWKLEVSKSSLVCAY